MQNVLTTLHEFLLAWLTNEDGFRDEHPDLKEALTEYGYGDVGPEELSEALPLVAEDMPLDYQRAVYQYLNVANESNVDSGSTFNVSQGGAQAGNDIGAQGTAAVAATAEPMETYPGEDPLDAAVRHVYNIQNNYSYIDDSGDVTNTVTNLGGNVDFDANTATGDGAFAGDGNEGIVQGDNYGINAGDDVEDVNFVGGDNYGQQLNDVEDSNVIGGDSGVALAGNAYAEDIGNVNVGDGTQTVVEDVYDSAVNTGDYGEANDVDVENYGDGSVTQVNAGSGDSTNEIDTDIKIEDSYNTEDSYNDDSYNEVDVDQTANVGYGEDGYEGDGSGETYIEQEAEVEIGDEGDDYSDLASQV